MQQYRLSPLNTASSLGEDPPPVGPAPAEGEEAEEDVLGFKYALVWLAVLTVFISVLSEALVGSIEATASSVPAPQDPAPSGSSPPRSGRGCCS